MSTAPNYLEPGVPSGLRRVSMPLVVATEEALNGYGRLVDDPQRERIEIVRWPAQGWRPVDLDSGDEGGTTEGRFISYWDGDVLLGSNEAVGGEYVLGYGCEPAEAVRGHASPPRELLLWHANYHPDGGQMFYPLSGGTFLCPLALPGDDVRPDDFVCFVFDGSRGLYIHPNIWHDGVYAVSGRREFFGRQGAVHARVSVDFAREFGCLLQAPLSGLE